MLSQKVLDLLKNEPKLLPENQAKYKEILDRNGIKKNSDFYVFMSEYGGDMDGSLGYMINVPEDLSDTETPHTLEAIKITQQYYGNLPEMKFRDWANLIKTVKFENELDGSSICSNL